MTALRTQAEKSSAHDATSEVLGKVSALGRMPLDSRIYREDNKGKIPYRRLLQEEKEERALANKLKGCNEDFTEEDKQELEQIRIEGFQMLVDTLEMFVQRQGRLPSDPPLALQTLEPQLLQEEARDWTLAHEEMRLAQRLQQARHNGDFTDAQVEQFHSFDHSRNVDMQSILDRLHGHYHFVKNFSSSHVKETGAPIPRSEYDLLTIIAALRWTPNQRERINDKIRKTLGREKNGIYAAKKKMVSHRCDAYRMGVAPADRLEKELLMQQDGGIPDRPMNEVDHVGGGLLHADYVRSLTRPLALGGVFTQQFTRGSDTVCR